jgi:hypothetical protein
MYKRLSFLNQAEYEQFLRSFFVILFIIIHKPSDIPHLIQHKREESDFGATRPGMIYSVHTALF